VSLETLTILDYGLIEYLDGDTPLGNRLSVAGYLLRTSDGQVVLVDAGWPASFVDGYDVQGWKISIAEEHLLPAQLARAGLRAEDVDLVVLTHADAEHIGGIEFLPGVPVVVSRAERETTPRIMDRPGVWPDNEYRLVDPDVELMPGVELLASPGHSPGHMSVLVRLPETGAVLLLGDALHTRREYETRLENPTWTPEHEQSAQRLLDVASAEDALVLYPHDHDQWQTLRVNPASYR
jgi:N-acyl homoserine lactone hydrolase